MKITKEFKQAHFNLNNIVEDIKNIAESVKKTSSYKDVRNILGLTLDEFEIVLCADIEFLENNDIDLKNAYNVIDEYYNDFDKLINSVVNYYK